jgi:mercuric ion transport protein
MRREDAMNHDACERPARGEGTRVARVADSAGVLGALFAALCCAGIPVIVGALSAVGLSFLRTDALLLPLLVVSLVVALWGLMKGRDVHGSSGPFLLGTVGGLSLVLAVRGFGWLLWPGTMLLIGAVIWNLVARRRSRLEPSVLR